MKLEQELKRIIENEQIRTELEVILKLLKYENTSCKHFTLESRIIRKYGIRRGSLIDGILSSFLDVEKEKKEV